MEINRMGFHNQDSDPRHITQLIQIFTVGEVVYSCNIAITKIAVLLLYYRLLRVAFQTSKTLRVIAYGTSVLVIISALVLICTSIFECTPVQKKWLPNTPGHCMDQTTPWILNAVLTILTDVAILVLPVPHIWKMRLGILEKIGVTSIFALGWWYVTGYFSWPAQHHACFISGSFAHQSGQRNIHIRLSPAPVTQLSRRRLFLQYSARGDMESHRDCGRHRVCMPARVETRCPMDHSQTWSDRGGRIAVAARVSKDVVWVRHQVCW